MRKLMATLAMVCLAVATSTSSWALFGLQDVKFDGSLEVNGVSANNERDLGGVKTSGTGSNDQRGVTDTRVRVGINSSVTENVTGRLEAVRHPASAGSSALYGGAGKPTSPHTELGAFSLYNAYVDIKGLWGTDARVGRQYAGEAGDVVWAIGPKSDDNLSVNSIDGLWVRCSEAKTNTFWDKLHLDLFAGKFSESTANPSLTEADVASGDVNLNNIALQLSDVLPGGRIWTGVLIGDKENTTTTPSDNDHLRIFRVGLDGGVAENMFTYRAEYLQNFGQLNRTPVGTLSDLNYKGNAFDLGAGFNSKETPAGTFGVWAGYFFASGDDTNDNDDKSFHDFSKLGADTSDRYFGEIFGKSNALAGTTVVSRPLGNGAAGVNSGAEGQGLRVFNIGVSYKPTFAPKTSAKVEYLTLSRDKSSLTTSVAGVTTTTPVGSKFGNEIDLTLGYKHTDNVMLEAGYASLKSDEALEFIKGNPISGTQQDNVTKLFARATVKWGGEEK